MWNPIITEQQQQRIYTNPMYCIYAGIGEQWLYLYFKKFHYAQLFRVFEMEYGQKDILCLQYAMKHPHLWKYFYFNMVKECSNLHEWHTLMEKAHSFSDWYHTTPVSDRSYLSPISMAKQVPVIETTTLADTLQKSYISGYFDRERQNESKTIQTYVEEFVLDITKKIENSKKKLAATPILSGSVAEGTKVGYPDEYDFILHLHGLQDEFDETSKSTVLTSTPHFEVQMDIAQLLREYLDVFNEHLQKYEHRKNFFLHKSAKNSSVRPFTIILSQTGIFFKYLKVNIDFVPAFTISYQKVQEIFPRISPACVKGQIFAIMKNCEYQSVDLRLSFSVHERDLINSLPMYVQNGYRLSKAIRHKEVCPNAQVLGMMFTSVDEYVTTYMLKTCLLHTMEECEHKHLEDNEWLSPLSIKWAIKIYEQMKYFLDIFEGKIPYYFQPTADICSRYQVENQRGEYEEECYQRKQKITLTFINYILQLLYKLLQQRLQVRCLIQ